MPMKTKELLAVEWCRDHQFNTEADRGVAFLAGFEAGVEARGGEIEHLTTELKRMHNCCFMSLLEATAWMGIPEHKREKFIEDHMGNANFILKQALLDKSDSNKPKDET